MFPRSCDWTTFLPLRKTPSFCNSVDVWSSMSCIVLDFQLADKNVIKKSRVFFDGKVQACSFHPRNKYKPTKQSRRRVRKNRRCKKKENKRFQGNGRAFFNMITKHNRPNKTEVNKGTEFAEEFKKFYKADGIQIYSTMSETRVAFAERTIRSVMNILYR